MAGKPDYIGQLEACGWFEGWPKDAADKYRRRIGTGLKRAEEPWQALALICGDAECIEGQGDFTAALKDIARQSCGLIKPAKVQESWDDDPVLFSFELGGRRFETRLPLEGDYLPAEFHELLARAVGDACKPLRLRGLSGGGQFFSYVLVAPEALKAAVKKRLIPAKRVEKELRARTPPRNVEDESPKEDSRPVMEREWFQEYVALHRRSALLAVARGLGLQEDQVADAAELAPLWSADPIARTAQALSIRDRLTSTFTNMPLLFVCPLKTILGARTVEEVIDGFVRAFAGALEVHDARIMAYGADPDRFFRELDIPSRLRGALAAELDLDPDGIAPATDLRRDLGLNEHQMADLHRLVEETLACPHLTPLLQGTRTFGELCSAAHRELLASCHATARRGGLDFPKGYQLPAGDPDRWATFTFEAAAAPAEPAAFDAMLPQPSARPPLALAWRKKISGKGDSVGLAQIGGGRLFVAAGESDLEAWDLRTGEFLWKVAKVRTGVHFRVVAGLLLSTLIVDRPRGARSVRRLAAMDPETGGLRGTWDDLQFIGEHGQDLVFSFSRGEEGGRHGFLAMDPRSLKTLRQAELPTTYMHLAGDTVIAVEHAAKGTSLVSYGLASGQELARKAVSENGHYEAPRHSHEDLVVTVSTRRYIACRRAADLEELWRLDARHLDVVSAETRASGGKLLVSTSRSGPDLQGPEELHCLDMRTGRTLWRKGNDPNIFLPPEGNLYWTHCPLIYLRKGFHRLTAMSLETGEPVWSCDVEGKEYLFVDACASGHLYCRTCDRAGPVETMCFRTSEA